MKKTVLVLWLTLLFLPALQAAEIPPTLGAVLEKAAKAYELVRDYRAVFQKQERSGTVLGPQETIYLKFQQPFKIFMIWTNTHKKGLQVLYERGKNNGKLVIHQPGLLLGLAPVIQLDQNSPWVKEGSESYDIEDAGIGSFLEDFSKAVQKGAEENKLQVVAAGSAGDEMIEVTFTGSKENEGFFAYRIKVRFGVESGLPDRMELFDWKNEPMGVYAYEDLRVNIGDEDPEFKKLALKKIYQRYWLPQQRRSQVSNNFSGKNPRATPTAG